ncbi:MAG: hypothetical protein ABI703_08270 [Gemmatimonadales bacterium]
MCYFLYLASPLTLSEVRSMLPAGLTADLASLPDQQTLKALHPPTQTVIRILAGRCSCDLIRRRLDDPREDERHLRERYRGLKIPRAATITALERHRRPAPVRPHADWCGRLAEFVAEHARNAGPSIYYLQFSAGSGGLRPLGQPARLTVSAVAAGPTGWLQEGLPALVTR